MKQRGSAVVPKEEVSNRLGLFGAEVFLGVAVNIHIFTLSVKGKG